MVRTEEQKEKRRLAQKANFKKWYEAHKHDEGYLEKKRVNNDRCRSKIKNELTELREFKKQQNLNIV